MENQPITPIAFAVEPLRNEAIADARNFAQDYIDKLLTGLKKVGNDAEIFAPYPSGNCSRSEYSLAHTKYHHVREFTTSKEYSRRPHSPDIRTGIDFKRIENFIDNAGRDASIAFDAYVSKLNYKVGDHSSASLLTYHNIWGYSILDVTLPDGSLQKWKTQKIFNISKLGKVFSQYPTRLMKGVE